MRYHGDVLTGKQQGHPAMSYPIPTRVRFVMLMEWLFRRWLQVFLLVFGLFNLLAALAPISMAAGMPALGHAIYDLYGAISHQYAHRSYFLFGDQMMYSPAELPLELNGNFDHDASLLKQFRGSPELGWKWAYSDRLVSLFGSMWIMALIYWLWRGRGFEGLSVRVGILLILPLIVDGLTHMISDSAGMTSGFRADNQWLANLTGGVFGAAFYAGDGSGTFNHLMRLLTGLLFAMGLLGSSLIPIEGYFRERATILSDKLQKWHARQRGSDTSPI